MLLFKYIFKLQLHLYIPTEYEHEIHIRNKIIWDNSKTNISFLHEIKGVKKEISN